MAEPEPVEDEVESSPESPPEAGEPKDDAGGPAKPVSAPKRTAKFRAGLLEKLCTLGYTGWSVKDNLKIDAEWGGVVNLKADAVLGPLEQFAPERRG
jgi:hypothetical protein